MIELVDDALTAWLTEVVPASRRAGVELVLVGIEERRDLRDNQVHDERDPDGRLVGRRRAPRWFQLDYLCRPVAPDRRERHRALGAVVQALVDHDALPAAHQPSFVDAGTPVPVELGPPPSAISTDAGGPEAALVVRVVVPVEPAPSAELAPPVEHLHLDVAQPEAAPDGDAVAPAVVDPATRRWTTVRRRELVTPRDAWAER